MSQNEIQNNFQIQNKLQQFSKDYIEKTFNFFKNISPELIKPQEIKLNDGTTIFSIPALEYILCKKDKFYFFNNYCKILHPIKGIIPFKIYNSQKRLVNLIDNERFIVILKTRQAGFSTTLALYSLHLINFFPAKIIECFSISEEESTIVYKKVELAYNNLPFWMKTQTVHQTTTQLENSLKSSFTAKTTSPNKGSGSSLSLLILDEAAKIPHINQMWAAVYPTISTGGKVIVNSTANGLGNWFANIYLQAVKKQNEFAAYFVDWWQIPERDNEWLEKVENNDYSFLPENTSFQMFLEAEEKGNNEWVKNQVKNLGSWDLFCQEYKGEFLGTGRTVLDNKTLIYLQQITNSTTILMEGQLPQSNCFIKSLEIYNFVEKNHEYLTLSDVASGRGDDYSTIIIFDLTTQEQVAEYCDRIEPHTLAKYIKQISTYYNNSFVLVESNAVGLAVLSALLNDNDPETYYENVFVQEKNNGYRSVEITAKTREEDIFFFTNALQDNEIKIKSKRLVSELLTFIWQQRRSKQIAIAETGCHDDLIMAFSLLGYFYNYIYNKSYNNNLGAYNYFDKVEGKSEDDFFFQKLEEEDPLEQELLKDIKNQFENIDDDKMQYIKDRVMNIIKHEDFFYKSQV